MLCSPASFILSELASAAGELSSFATLTNMKGSQARHALLPGLDDALRDPPLRRASSPCLLLLHSMT